MDFLRLITPGTQRIQATPNRTVESAYSLKIPTLNLQPLFQVLKNELIAFIRDHTHVSTTVTPVRFIPPVARPRQERAASLLLHAGQQLAAQHAEEGKATAAGADVQQSGRHGEEAGADTRDIRIAFAKGEPQSGRDNARTRETRFL